MVPPFAGKAGSVWFRSLVQARTIENLREIKQRFFPLHIRRLPVSIFHRHSSTPRNSLVAAERHTEFCGSLRKSIELLKSQIPEGRIGAPKPFKIVKDAPEEMEIKVQRIYGLEDIEIDCIMQLVPRKYQPKAMNGDLFESRAKMLQLTISITKGADEPVLKMLCECYRDGFVLHQVDLKCAAVEDCVYRPYFSKEKDKLVNEFQIFLYDRGLNANLTHYLHSRLEEKRLKKSVYILTQIEQFVSS